MPSLKLATVFCLSCLAGAAFAQSAGDRARGSIPPGSSQDGSRPADGAITGGRPIVPGESGGLPDKDAASGTSDERLQHCRELGGSLRVECLRKERGAAGGSSPPSDQGNIRMPR